MTHHIHGVEPLRRRAVGDETAEILSDEAADVEEGGAGLEFLDDGRVGGGFGEHGVEPETEACAGVGADGPGFVALGEV